MTLTQLRELALKATPGPWRVGPSGGYVLNEGYRQICTIDDRTDANTAYIAAVSPDVILKLIDELEAAYYELRNQAALEQR